MALRSGLGETGEAYLVGPDGRMRSDSFCDPEHHSVMASFQADRSGLVETEGLHAALKGEVGVSRQQNYADREVICARTPVTIAGLTWALLVEMEAAEALGTIATMKAAGRRSRRNLSLTIALVVLLISGAIGYIGLIQARAIVHPIRRTADALERVAQGHLDSRVELDSEDEIGQMASALNDTMHGVATALQAEHVDWEAIAGQRAELDRVASLVASSPLALAFADETGVIHHVTPRGIQLFTQHSGLLGVGGEHSIGRRVAKLFPDPGDGEEALACADATFARHIEVDGAFFDITTTWAEGADGVHLGFVIRIDDVTDAVRSARRADELQSAELANAARLKSEAERAPAPAKRASPPTTCRNPRPDSRPSFRNSRSDERGFLIGVERRFGHGCHARPSRDTWWDT